MKRYSVPSVIGLITSAVALAACSSADIADPATATLAAPTTTALAAPTTTDPILTTTIEETTKVVTMPSGDPAFAGYPLVVQNTSIDDRVASWYALATTDQGQSVALAPGVYRPYNPNVRDLWRYYDGPVEGDCIMIAAYFATSASTCWDGVLAGDQEPLQQ